MIEFQYREIAKIMELVDYELGRVNAMKNKNITSISAAGQTDGFVTDEDLYSAERSRVEDQIKLLESIKAKYEEALNKVVFRFTQDNTNRPTWENKNERGSAEPAK